MDRIVDYATKSMAYHIKVNASGINNAYVVSPDFDWDNKPNPSQPGSLGGRRELPFAGVVLVKDIDEPFSVGNILYSTEILLHIELCCESYTQLVQMTRDIRQSIRTSVNPQTSNVGIVLYNFALASGSYYANAGTMQAEIQGSEYFGPEDPLKQQNNRKYLSITPVILSAYKDVTATLLENMGRVDLTDS